MNRTASSIPLTLIEAQNAQMIQASEIILAVVRHTTTPVLAALDFYFAFSTFGPGFKKIVTDLTLASLTQ